MPCLWLQHNNSQLFVNVGIIDASTANLTSGPVFGAHVPAPPPMFSALIDTGAQKTMISSNVATSLSLQIQGQVQVQGVSSVQWHNAYLFHVAFILPIILPGQPVPILGQPVQLAIHINPNVIYGAELPALAGFDVLLGMDVLSSGSLKIEGSGHYSFSF
jgi:hypothetical protein